MAASEPGPVRWYSRLSLRLAIFLGVALLVFQFAGVPLYSWVMHSLGLPAPDETYVFNPFAEPGATIDEAVDRLGGALLLGAIDPMTGRVAPTSEACALVERMLPGGDGYVWLDADDIVRQKSAWLPWHRDSRWPHGIESHTDVPFGDEAGRLVHVVYAPQERDRRHVGTFVLVSTPSPDGRHLCEADWEGTALPGLILTDDRQLARRLTRRSLVTNALSVGLAFLATTLLIWALSRWVTRRLRRLAAAAGRPGADPHALPGPFEVSGDDEIAVLAQSMNTMRARAIELLDGLAARDVSRREWVAQVSHDLRTPLTALMACLDRADLLLLRSNTPVDLDAVRDVLNVARFDADRVQAIADDLIEIARLDSSADLIVEPVPPGELVRQTVRGFGPMAAERGIDLTTRVVPALPVMQADGRRLMRALENLIRNAIQHARAAVTVSADRVPEGLRFEVRDDGPGFPLVDGRVDFAALGAARKRSDASNGLGLLVTRKVAEAHGGLIGARNGAEGGAVIWFAIPFEEGDDGDDLAEASPS